jgi:hypothetical protein
MKRPVPSGYFAVWTGTTPLLVFEAASLRDAREAAASEEFLRMLRHATVISNPLLPYGAKVWIGLASDDERSIFDRALAAPNPFGGNTDIVWVQPVDRN